MQTQNTPLEKQYHKLQQINPIYLDLSFVLGYIIAKLPPGPYPHLAIGFVEMIEALYNTMIKPQHVLQILAVINDKIINETQSTIENLSTIVAEYTFELAINENYLINKYISPKIEVLQRQGMGQCPICLCPIEIQSVCLLSCGHMFHKVCFNHCINQKIINKIFPLICPQESCKHEISTQEINQYLTKQLKQKYQQFTFQKYVEEQTNHTNWCPTPGCSAVFNNQRQISQYKCTVCRKQYCLRCKCEKHQNFTCKQYQKIAGLDQPDRKFMILVKGEKFKQCPSCKFWVQKNKGCDHMTCRCKYQFCYVCGGKYGDCRCKNGGPGEIDSQQEQIHRQRRQDYDSQQEQMPRLQRFEFGQYVIVRQQIQSMSRHQSSPSIQNRIPSSRNQVAQIQNHQQFRDFAVKNQRQAIVNLRKQKIQPYRFQGQRQKQQIQEKRQASNEKNAQKRINGTIHRKQVQKQTKQNHYSRQYLRLEKNQKKQEHYPEDSHVYRRQQYKKTEQKPRRSQSTKSLAKKSTDHQKQSQKIEYLQKKSSSIRQNDQSPNKKYIHQKIIRTNLNTISNRIQNSKQNVNRYIEKQKNKQIQNQNFNERKFQNQKKKQRSRSYYESNQQRKGSK